MSILNSPEIQNSPGNLNTILFQALSLGYVLQSTAETTHLEHPQTGTSLLFETKLLLDQTNNPIATLEYLENKLSVLLLSNLINQDSAITQSQLVALQEKGYSVEFIFTSDNILVTISNSQLSVVFARHKVVTGITQEQLSKESWSYWIECLLSPKHNDSTVQEIITEKIELRQLTAETLAYLAAHIPPNLEVITPPLSEQIVVDFIFVERRDDGVISPHTLTLAGLSAKQNGTNPPELTEYENVAAISIVDDTLPLSDRKKLSRIGASELGINYPQLPPPRTVITVDRTLLEAWKKNGLTIQTTKPRTARQAIDYGSLSYSVASSPPDVSLLSFGEVAIGGT